MSIAILLLRSVAWATPAGIARRLSLRLIGDDPVALCFHRVGDDSVRAGMLMPELCHDAAIIDELIEWLAPVPGGLTMSFDDGYADAAEYVSARAPRHPEVSWHFMVCPQKTIDRNGFPWDDWIDRPAHGEVAEFLAEWKHLFESAGPLARGSVGGADREHCRLATVEECRALASFDNVQLGNHTDRHLPSAWLSNSELVAEIATSQQRFVDTFGATDHFAFPFGAEPWVTVENIGVALDALDGTVWTIGSSAVVADGRVRPRFSMRSTDGSAKATVLVIAVRCRLAARRAQA
ncbi:MAG: hypothetical protein AB8G14_08190 [Ilumatobacter sp.]